MYSRRQANVRGNAQLVLGANQAAWMRLGRPAEQYLWCRDLEPNLKRSAPTCAGHRVGGNACTLMTWPGAYSAAFAASPYFSPEN